MSTWGLPLRMSNESEPKQISEGIEAVELPRSGDSGIMPLADEGATSAAPEQPTVVRGSSTSRRSVVEVLVAPTHVLPKPGDLVAGFQIQEAIGVGGMGAVFRAHDLQLDRHVALKLLPPDQTVDPEIVQRFYQEGRSAAQLDHENIARVFSIGHDGPHHFIVFEFIEGKTVRRRVDEEGPLPIPDAVDITLQIAQALVHAAERGVVHRDIKPSNIILTPQGTAKLVDMGLARRFERERDLGLTQSGMTLGTFDYISPEQARDPRDVDVRSDLYSLGCTLFHMLTGQPPFAGGTVLQKLLQHQEEPPPDVRSLNPAVPPELARILAKLLAKDRDRRYQTPEQLACDLLAIAGKVGLAFDHADHPSWMAANASRFWERHLVWSLPAVAFLLILVGLVWWGREPASQGPSPNPLSQLQAEVSEGLVKVGSLAATSETRLNGTAAESGTAATGSSPRFPRAVTARPGDDLVQLIATSGRRSVITLSEDGPYFVGGRNGGMRGSGPLPVVDVTIKAEAGARPVVRFASDARLVDRPLPALLGVSGGRLTVDGVIFELDSDNPETQTAAIQTEETELTLRGCTFRQLSARSNANHFAVQLRNLRAATETGDRPPAAVFDQCHFDGGQVGIHVEGAADLVLRDCTFGSAIPAVWLDNRQRGGRLPAELRLRHCSFMAGGGPLFRVDGTLARIHADDCAIAPGSAEPVIVVATDDPRNVIWRGRSNLYFGIRAFMASTEPGDRFPAVEGFAQWAETPAEIREVGSHLAASSVWRSADPLRELLLDRDDATRAFQIAPEFLAISTFGARQGPRGTQLVDPARRSPRIPDHSAGLSVAANSAQVEKELDLRTRPPEEEPAGPPPSLPMEMEDSLAQPMSPAPSSSRSTAAAALSEMPPMSSPGLADDLPTAAAPLPIPEFVKEPTAAPPGRTTSGNAGGDSATAATRNFDSGREGTAVVQTPEEFSRQLDRLDSQGGTIRLAHDADLELSTFEFRGQVSRRIEAEPGARRPRLRFRPFPQASTGATGWSALFHIRSGSLTLDGIDLVILKGDASATGRQALVGVWPGAELKISGCTLTVAGVPSFSAALAIPSPPGRSSLGSEDDPPPAQIEIRNSFLRSSGDGVLVGSDRRLHLELWNTLVATDSSLLHALGRTRAPADEVCLRMGVHRVLARCKGGVVHLESSVDEPEIPLTEIIAESSIFSTAEQDNPLLRVDGQRQIEELRDRIRWTAERVAYHQITNYRRDQILQTGVSPQNYTLSDWKNAFDPKDESPVFGDLRFLRKPEAWHSSWALTKDDLRLDPRSPVAKNGPDFTAIPAPPPADS
jgi:hypothetical protein